MNPNADNADADFDIPASASTPPSQPMAPPVKESKHEETEEAPQVQPQAQPPKMELPDNLKEAFALLNEVEHMPENNPREIKAKNEALALVRKHVFELQQGTPAPTVSADFLAQDHQRGFAERRMIRLENEARTSPDVKWLLEAYRALLAQSTK